MCVVSEQRADRYITETMTFNSCPLSNETFDGIIDAVYLAGHIAVCTPLGIDRNIHQKCEFRLIIIVSAVITRVRELLCHS